MAQTRARCSNHGLYHEPRGSTSAAEVIGLRASHLYGLVNNAALLQHPRTWPLADISVSDWSDLLATNVTGQWLVSKAVLPLMIKNGSFRKVFMTSVVGWAFTPGFGPYNLTKAAVNNLGASLAVECAAHFPDKDVQINVLVPGEARTEMRIRTPLKSPFSVVCMTLALLSHLTGGPNGYFFHRDGRHLTFAYVYPFPRSLLDPGEGAGIPKEPVQDRNSRVGSEARFRMVVTTSRAADVTGTPGNRFCYGRSWCCIIVGQRICPVLFGFCGLPCVIM